MLDLDGKVYEYINQAFASFSCMLEREDVIWKLERDTGQQPQHD